MAVDSAAIKMSAPSKRESSGEVSVARYALLCSCIALNCITAASPFIFSLVGPTLTRQMGLTMSQTNAISLGAIMGQYGAALFMGAFADKSARLASLLAGVLFTSGFAIMAYSLTRNIPPTYPFFVGLFGLAGSGTVASYLAALAASAKSFPDHAGLAIGIPSALLGVSPLFLSTIGSALFTVSEGEYAGDINAVGLFAFLAVLNGLVNLFSACFIEPVIIPEEDTEVPDEVEDDASTLPVVAAVQPSEGQPLLPTHKAHPSHVNILLFLRQHTVWIFMTIVLLINGPSEVISQNLGSLSEALIPATITGWPDHETLSSRKRQIQIFSIVNTVTRVGFGALSDWTSPSVHGERKAHFTTPRITYIQLAAVVLFIASTSTAFLIKSIDTLWVLSVGSGFSYGIISTIGPSLVSRVWGEADFGRNFGIVWSLAAGGPLLFGTLYGRVSDHYADRQHTQGCKGSDCYQITFCVIAVGSLAALVLTTILRRRKDWRRV